MAKNVEKSNSRYTSFGYNPAIKWQLVLVDTKPEVDNTEEVELKLSG